MRNKLSSEHRKIIFAAFLMMVMIVGMVFIFAIYFYWFSHIGNNQGLLSGLHNYENIRLLFTTSVYFSFVTYFTLGYGDLVPYGFWMKSFVFLECIMSILNTGLMFIYVYNFLFNNFTEPNDKTHPHKQSNNM
ncbi:potassium channel family protein [Desulfonispora thiosulfatigenes]|nr:potassium channel family protein [Desulfonispora thiosulfatigenes]